MQQPFDISIFRPFKYALHQKMHLWTVRDGPDAVNINNFHQLLMPCYLKAMKKHTLVNGFKRAGIHPFEPANVDWDTVAGVEKKNEAFQAEEGIDIDGQCSRGTKTMKPCTVDVSVQTASSGGCRYLDLSLLGHCGGCRDMDLALLGRL